MDKRVRDLRERIDALRALEGAQREDALLRQFSEILADLDSMSIETFFQRLLGKEQKSAITQPKPPFDQRAAVAKLRQTFRDDDAFHRAMTEIERQRSATKPVLTKIFYELFDRTRGVPSKATRAELLRLIEDERNILVRNEKMGQMLGSRIVPAE